MLNINSEIHKHLTHRYVQRALWVQNIRRVSCRNDIGSSSTDYHDPKRCPALSRIGQVIDNVHGCEKRGRMRAERLLESGNRMTLQHVDILFQLIVFLFAISVHESAHAWMANRCGDPTARMLGRITLNPIKHIDPIGTILLPAIALFAHIPVLGWAKPTPVDPRNFKNPVRDDVLTAVVGPISNFLVATLALIVLAAVALAAPGGRIIVQGVMKGLLLSNSALVPLSLLVYQLLVINVVLAVFNLIPVPPLDGSHVLRHFLSERIRRAYDMVGFLGLLALIYLAPGLLTSLITPVLGLYQRILMSV